MGTLELPARMSPCLRLFIEMLFDDVVVKHSASLYQKRETQPALPAPVRAEGGDAGVAGIYERNSWGLSRMKHYGITMELRVRQIIVVILPIMAMMLGIGKDLMAQTNASTAVKNVVLVHGGFVDGSGWEGVYKILTEKGYNVTVVQNPTISLADDVAVTKRAIDAQDGPVILVGHSYGGVVISSAGDDPKVVGLVYICAFAADTGESVLSLIKTAPAGAPAPPIPPPQDGFLFLDREKFAGSFAADVKPEIADFMANSQVPWGLAAASAGATAAAWKTKPNWYLLTTEDHMIAPELQRFMSKRAGSKVVEIKGSHAIYVSQPDAVATLIDKAANAPLVAAR